MFKYSLDTITRNLYSINKNGLPANASKIDDIIFHPGTHRKQSFRKSILNLIRSESLPQMFAIFANILDYPPDYRVGLELYRNIL